MKVFGKFLISSVLNFGGPLLSPWATLGAELTLLALLSSLNGRDGSDRTIIAVSTRTLWSEVNAASPVHTNAFPFCSTLKCGENPPHKFPVVGGKPKNPQPPSTTHTAGTWEVIQITRREPGCLKVPKTLLARNVIQYNVHQSLKCGESIAEAEWTDLKLPQAAISKKSSFGSGLRSEGNAPVSATQSRDENRANPAVVPEFLWGVEEDKNPTLSPM